MRLPLTITSALLVLAQPVPAADWEGIYQGTLGKAKVLVQLVEPLDDMEGETKRETSRYSYLPRTRDLNLVLGKTGKTLVFDETPQPFNEFAGEGAEKVITGKWSLTPAAGSARGTWISPDGKKKLPISLTRIPDLPAEDRNTDLNIWSDTYNEAWLNSVSFSDDGPARTFGSVEVRWLKDSAYGLKFPVLGAFPDEARKDRANAKLMKAIRKSLGNYRDCKNGVPENWEPENQQEIFFEVTYASPEVLSFTESGSVYCGGAHPANYALPVTYDLAQAAQMGGKANLDLAAEGFGRVLKLGSKDERIAFERFALGRWKAGAEADKEMGADCGSGWIEDAPEGARDFSLSFTDKGLAVLRTDFPHVASNCLFTDFNPAIIPWPELLPWLRPGQTLLTTELRP
ncbi:MAG: hypothetical protein JNM45_07505 [Rhizobiales bacterium]|nr:hypothetical protein [Hyphomicrobiales bacterium]